MRLQALCKHRASSGMSLCSAQTASAAGQIGSERASRLNSAERVYSIEAAHNPEVAGSNPAPATEERPAHAGLLVISLRVPHRSLPPPLDDGDQVLALRASAVPRDPKAAPARCRFS